MITLRTIFAVVSAGVGISCFIPYIRDILIRKTTPHSYSWLIWTILQTTGVLAMLSGGAGLGALSLSIGAALCGFIFLLSLRYGTKNITTFDTICFVGTLGATSIYIFLHDALLSVIMVTLIDLVAFLPTLRKAYEEPYSETMSTYFLSGLSSIFALGALYTFSITTSLYLISLIITNNICAFIILIRRK